MSRPIIHDDSGSSKITVDSRSPGFAHFHGPGGGLCKRFDAGYEECSEEQLIIFSNFIIIVFLLVYFFFFGNNVVNHNLFLIFF